MTLKNHILRLGLMLAATTAQAETFSVSLGKITLGKLVHTGTSGGASLKATLDNTPMGVFDGTFNGTAKPATATDGTPVIHYNSVSKSSRKSRSVQVQIAKGRALATDVTPSSEITNLSDPAKAPKNITDPARAIGMLINSSGCPARINIYDGRRAIALIPGTSETKDDKLICSIAYKVTAGPGHLSPLKISKAKMKVTYDTTNGQSLQQITLRSGPFNLVLDQTN